MKDYHDLYLKCNTLLLPDVLENFGKKCLENHSWCPSHYLSTPALLKFNA